MDFITTKRHNHDEIVQIVGRVVGTEIDNKLVRINAELTHEETNNLNKLLYPHIEKWKTLSTEQKLDLLAKNAGVIPQ